MPQPTTVHAIRRWSGKPEDEAPLCAPAGESWRFQRTIYRDTVTCQRCNSIIVQEDLEGVDDAPEGEWSFGGPLGAPDAVEECEDNACTGCPWCDAQTPTEDDGEADDAWTGGFSENH